MKKLVLIIFGSLFLLAGKPERKDIVAENIEFASKQLQYALDEMRLATINESEQSIHNRAENGWSELCNPRSLDQNGNLLMTPSKDWCSGFFPGELWYMYELTGNEKWRSSAHRQTIILEREKYNGTTHDMGFKMYCSYGNAYRLTGDSIYRNVLIQSAKTLATRFNPVIGCIRSWDSSLSTRVYPVIIDNMLNLELLFWASRETGDNLYRDIAVHHAETTLKNHFRKDGSSYHVVDYDPKTGKVRDRYTHQGLAKESYWARGQAWGLYGYTMCYRETGKKKFLEQARKIAFLIFSHPNLPDDLVPYWDYNVKPDATEPRDVSAATCTASALYELSLLDKSNATQYKEWADTILKNVTDCYRADLYTHKGFLLLHSTGGKLLNMEVDKPLVYADYYFLEALKRKRDIEKLQ